LHNDVIENDDGFTIDYWFIFIIISIFLFFYIKIYLSRMDVALIAHLLNRCYKMVIY
jgi:hypothetical protein